MITASEHALSRVLGYLRLCGVPMDRDVRIAALRLVEEVVAASPVPYGADGDPDDESGLIEAVMLRFPQRFQLPEPSFPPVFPRIERGSIHYDDGR